MESEIHQGAKIRPLPVAGVPAARYGQSCTWSGSEMIIWGGVNGSTHHGDGARYQPGSDLWAPISSTNAPSARKNHSAVCTGSEYIVWGGGSGAAYLNGGGRFNPLVGVWESLSTAAPAARTQHSAVWAQGCMLIFCGTDNTACAPFGDISSYVPPQTVFICQHP